MYRKSFTDIGGLSRSYLASFLAHFSPEQVYYSGYLHKVMPADRLLCSIKIRSHIKSVIDTGRSGWCLLWSGERVPWLWILTSVFLFIGLYRANNHKSSIDIHVIREKWENITCMCHICHNLLRGNTAL